MAIEIATLSQQALDSNLEGEPRDNLLKLLSDKITENNGNGLLLSSLNCLLTSYITPESDDFSPIINFVKALYNDQDDSSTRLPENRFQFIDTLQSALVDLLYVHGYSIDSDLSDIKELLNSDAFASDNITEDDKKLKSDLDLRIQHVEGKKASYARLVNSFVEAQLIQEHLIKARMDGSLLRMLNIPKGSQAQQNLIRFEARRRTQWLYKQQKYNLTREESEGYSKLLVELLSNVGPPHNPGTGYPVESASHRKQRVGQVLRNIKSLIGYFDLDPTRVVDIILDVFSEQIVNYHCFFRELLRSSPWGSNNRNETCVSNTLDSNKERIFPDGSLPEKSQNSILGQVLGFKFQTQQNVHQKEVEKVWIRQEGEYKRGDTPDSTPSRLYLLAAVLISDGTVNLSDLYPHLSPTDVEMSSMKDKFEDDMDIRAASGSGNKLAMMGALLDDDESVDKDTTTRFDKSKATAPTDSPNQKLALLCSMLHIGALPESLFILGRFPFLAGPHPQLADALLRILNFMIDPVFRPLSFSNMSPQVYCSLSTPKLRYSTSEKAMVAQAPELSRLTPEPYVEYNGKFKNIFFWPEWTSRLPLYENLDAIRDHMVDTMLPFVRVHLTRNMSFFTKFLRIIMNSLQDEKSSSNLKRWKDVIRRFILPSVCMSDKNPAVSVELWSILQQYDISDRFAFYGELNRLYVSIAELKVRKADISRESRDYMRRLSTDTIKTMGKCLAKLAHTNPLIVYEVMLNQIMSYDNFIGPAGDVARFLGPFELDVLQYVVITAYANPRTDTIKSDGTNLSLWLSSLANYTGNLLKKSNMPMNTILEYVLHELEVNHTDFLIILREILEQMSGISPISDLNSQQIRALGGGKVLRFDVLAPTESRPQPKFASQLWAGLKDGLATKLLIHLCLARQVILYVTPNETNSNLKYLGNMYDQCQAILFQYMEFLCQSDTAEYAALVPTFPDLIEKYDLEVTMSLTLLRPVLWAKVKEHDEERAKQEEALSNARLAALREKLISSRSSSSQSPAAEQVDTVSKKSTNNDTVISDVKTEEINQEEGEVNDIQESEKTPSDQNAMNVDNVGEAIIAEEENGMEVDVQTPEVKAEKDVNESKSELNDNISSSPWNPALLPVMESLDKILPTNSFSFVSTGLYATFWQLSLYDISDLGETYEKQYLRLRNVVSSAQNAYEEALNQPNIDIAVRRKRRTDSENCARFCPATQQKLRQEREVQSKDHQNVIKRLHREKNHWFPNQQGTLKIHFLNSLVFMQMCIYARSRLSPTDAVYCAHFLQLLHSLGTPGFNTLTYFDKFVFADHLTPMIFQMTEAEAANHGIFLSEILAQLTAWQKDPKLYKREAIGEKLNLHGFLRTSKFEDFKEEDFLSHDNFVTAMNKWHNCLLTSFKRCLESKEYMRVKNTLSIVYKISSYFPHYAVHGESLDSYVKPLTNDERGDIKMLAQGYVAVLQKQRQRGMWESRKSNTTPNVNNTSSSKSNIVSHQAPAGPRNQIPISNAAGLPPKPTSINSSTGSIHEHNRANYNTNKETEQLKPPVQHSNPSIQDRLKSSSLPASSTLPVTKQESNPTTADRADRQEYPAEASKQSTPVPSSVTAPRGEYVRKFDSEKQQSTVPQKKPDSVGEREAPNETDAVKEGSRLKSGESPRYRDKEREHRDKEHSSSGESRRRDEQRSREHRDRDRDRERHTSSSRREGSSRYDRDRERDRSDRRDRDRDRERDKDREKDDRDKKDDRDRKDKDDKDKDRDEKRGHLKDRNASTDTTTSHDRERRRDSRDKDRDKDRSEKDRVARKERRSKYGRDRRDDESNLSKRKERRDDDEKASGEGGNKRARTDGDGWSSAPSSPTHKPVPSAPKAFLEHYKKPSSSTLSSENSPAATPSQQAVENSKNPVEKEQVKTSEDSKDKDNSIKPSLSSAQAPSSLKNQSSQLRQLNIRGASSTAIRADSADESGIPNLFRHPMHDGKSSRKRNVTGEQKASPTGSSTPTESIRGDLLNRMGPSQSYEKGKPQSSSNDSARGAYNRKDGSRRRDGERGNEHRDRDNDRKR